MTPTNLAEVFGLPLDVSGALWDKLFFPRLKDTRLWRVTSFLTDGDSLSLSYSRIIPDRNEPLEIGASVCSGQIASSTMESSSFPVTSHGDFIVAVDDFGIDDDHDIFIPDPLTPHWEPNIEYHFKWG